MAETGTIRDTRMIQKALEQRWPITAEYREGVIKRLMRIVVDPASSPREVTAASKAILAAEGQNQADEQHVDHRMDAGRNRILELLEQRGSVQSYLPHDSGGSGEPASGDPEATQDTGSRG